jgi:hypothetical protein
VYKFAFASNWIPRICLKSTYEVAKEFHPFLISLLPVECGTQGMLHTHTRWFIWYEVHVHDVCRIEPDRLAPTDWPGGGRPVVRKAVNMAAERKVIGGSGTRNLTRRRSRIFSSFYLVWRFLWLSMMLNCSDEVDGFVWYNRSILWNSKSGDIVLWLWHCSTVCCSNFLRTESFSTTCNKILQ